MTAASLAQTSNSLIYSAIAVYALAMIAYAAEIAFGARSPIRSDVGTAARRPAYASGAGSTALAERPDAGESVGTPAGSPSAGDGEQRPDRIGRVAVSLTVLAFGLHLAGVLARGLSAGRVPWGNMYEFSITGGVAVTGAYLLLMRRVAVRYLGVVLIPTVLLILGLAVTVLYVESAQLVPALTSYWLVVHVLAAILSAGGFTVGAALTALYLLQARAQRRGRAGIWLRRLPTAPALDRLAYRVHAFTFPVYTFAVIAGAIWAENAWGRYWGWDPKETWAFITWIVYAGYLHARATAGWRGRNAALVALAGYACFTFNYFGVNLLVVGLHSYAR